MRCRAVVGNAKHEDGFAVGEDLFGVGAAGAGAVGGEVGHVGVMTLREPVFKGGKMRRRVGSRHTGQDESQPVRFVENGLFEAIGH